MRASWQLQVDLHVSHSELPPVASLVQTMCHLDCLHPQGSHAIHSPCEWLETDMIADAFQI